MRSEMPPLSLPPTSSRGYPDPLQEQRKNLRLLELSNLQRVPREEAEEEGGVRVLPPTMPQPAELPLLICHDPSLKLTSAEFEEIVQGGLDALQRVVLFPKRVSNRQNRVREKGKA